MTANEKWNSVCKHYSLIHSFPEHRIQRMWETIFSEFMGYSRLNNEIDVHRKIQIGSTEKVIPDIIIKNHKADLFLVELKQCGMSINESMKNQLFSYMRLLQNDLGILICNKIHLYGHHKEEDKQNEIAIDFTLNNPDGIRFIELFSKQNFSREAITDFFQGKNKAANNVQSIKEEMSKDLIYELLAKHFENRFTASEFEKAMDFFNISITQTSNADHKNLEKYHKPITTNQSIHITQENTLSKKEAIILCIKNKLPINGNITFSSENSSRKFWANPSKQYLAQNWWLLLNDFTKKQLHVFYIPGHSIQENQVCTRADKPDLIDLQIIPKGNGFEDCRSKLRLDKWYSMSFPVSN